MIEENKALVLEDGIKYWVLKKVDYSGHTYALALSLEDDSKFCIFQLTKTGVKFVQGKNLMAVILIEILKDEKFVKELSPKFDAWKDNLLKQE